MRIKHGLCLGVAALLLATGPALSTPEVTVPGQKIDSGLGELPHYSTWADPTGRQPLAHRVIGESLDDGLGDLPHFSQWIDRSGRDPMGTASARATIAMR